MVSSFFNSNPFFKTVCKYFYAKKFKHLHVSAKSTLHNYAVSTYIVERESVGQRWDSAAGLTASTSWDLSAPSDVAPMAPIPRPGLPPPYGGRRDPRSSRSEEMKRPSLPS